jgi:hypothetical protein
MPWVGFVWTGSREAGQPFFDALREGLLALHYRDGDNIVLEYRVSERGAEGVSRASADSSGPGEEGEQVMLDPQTRAKIDAIKVHLRTGGLTDVDDPPSVQIHPDFYLIQGPFLPFQPRSTNPSDSWVWPTDGFRSKRHRWLR